MRKQVKNRTGNEAGKAADGNATGEKRPFDKKTYRLKKYSNKYKIDQWEVRRKKAVLRNYYKELDKEQREAKRGAQRTKEEEKGEDARPKKQSAFYKAKQEFLRKKDEKRKRKEEALRVKAEKEEALKKYKEKKMQAYKKLSKKTKKGQPVMKDRLEMLLEKIQESASS